MINSLAPVKPWISSGSLIYSCPWCRLDRDWHICSQRIWLPGHHSNRAVLPDCTLPCPANPNPFTARPHTELCWPTKDRRQPISSLKLCPLTQDEKKNSHGTGVLATTNCWNRPLCLKTCDQEKKNHRESYHHIPIWSLAGLHFIIEKLSLLHLRKTYLS